MRTKSISKQQIIRIAYDLFCEKGIDHLTARKIAKSGHFSTYPIYCNFTSIIELQQLIIDEFIKKIDIHFKYSQFSSIIQFNHAFLNYIKNKPGISKSFFSDSDFSNQINNELIELMNANLTKRPTQEFLEYNSILIFSMSTYVGSTNYATEKTDHIIQFIMHSTNN